MSINENIEAVDKIKSNYINNQTMNNNYLRNNNYSNNKKDLTNGNNILNNGKSPKKFNAEEYFDNLMNSMKKK